MKDSDRVQVIVIGSGSPRTIPLSTLRKYPKKYMRVEEVDEDVASADLKGKSPEEQVKAIKESLKKPTPEPVKEAEEKPTEKDAELPQPPEADNKTEQPDYESMEVKELKALADEAGLSYAKNAGKKKMIEILTQ